MAREDAILNTRHKALLLNKNPLIYGSLAEIGAGQEVARQFFQAGGASGTIAKTMSAYDMGMSDSIYGVDQTGRYVSLTRLESMLDTEFTDLIKRVSENRSPESTFFAFADTVAAKAYKSDKDCHGWMGIKFQCTPGAEPSQIAMHVRLLDKTNREQQEALGILGVSLIHSSFVHSRNPEALVDALIEDIDWGRIEVDFIRLEGSCFKDVDNMQMNLRLVTSSLGPVVMFTPDRKAVVPADLIFRKNVLILRGNFRPFTNVHADMIQCGMHTFAQDLSTSEKNIVCFCEMNMAQYLSDGVDEVSDLEERVLMLTGKGYNVMVTSHFRYFRLSEYFSNHGKRKIGFILSVDNILSILDEKYYEGMEGGLLEAMGKLFTSDSKLLVYPNLTPDGELVTAENILIPDNQKYLYRHLHYNKRLLSLRPDSKNLVPFAVHPEPQ
ncbi:MAG: TonB-dependent receptor [Candidatus Eisenbacteria bacterium]|uniref:TonB-dependent receptor n=1 Tax=Eiseniibacteriota bacterium TaxID=2212470 RepID=A0A948RW09_UNCEI|nr:TonB-dependent receptor [Candidatus Eisenbacteria bacterium]MBU1947828.1 TonB-dependent receptor [Candidatus Eisenbacteria bacterium]MBU2689299.1 TonB-dependent receptor [Candidatus Eisenbacteria bacterium]